MTPRIVLPVIALFVSIACAEDPIASLPVCQLAAALPSSDWQRIVAPFDDITFSLPAAFHQASEPPQFMHGGGQWSGMSCNATVSYGMWGLSSFNPEGADNVCRTIINGIPTVLISSSGNDNHNVTVWLRTKAEPYEPVVSVRCSAKTDSAIAMAVVASIRRAQSK